jgi:hypothetical protein
MIKSFDYYEEKIYKTGVTIKLQKKFRKKRKIKIKNILDKILYNDITSIVLEYLEEKHLKFFPLRPIYNFFEIHNNIFKPTHFSLGKGKTSLPINILNYYFKENKK